MDGLQTRRKVIPNKKGKGANKDDAIERLLPTQTKKPASKRPLTPSGTDQSSLNIYLDEMILQSRDNLFRSSQKRKEAYKMSKSSSFDFSTSKPSVLFSYLCAHTGLIMRLYPKFSIFCSLCCIILLVLLFSHIAERHKMRYVIDTDYSDIKSVYDLSLGKIDHWCFVRDDDSCDCEDPLEPVSRGEYKQWVKAHKMNVETVKSAVTNTDLIDVVFLGETIVEEWNGKSIGRNQTKLEDSRVSFQNNFNTSLGGDFNGLAFGINGDTSPNVLWRLIHGEVDKNFNPKIWWLVIGTNDLMVQQCSEEVVLLGVLRVIEELMIQKPQATIIVNSILPMTMESDGTLMDSKKENLRKNEHAQDHIIYDISGKISESESNSEDYPKKKKRFDQRKTSFFSFGEQQKGMLWSSILEINNQLRKFCERHGDNIHFFDADEIFVDQNDRGESFLKLELLSIHGHPTKAGHEIWHRTMVKTLHDLNNINHS